VDGYEFLEELAREPALKAIPLAILTAGYGVDRARIGAQTIIVPKPINLPKLIEHVRSLGSREVAGE
jgi:CheY-like chemotaxis protein